MITIIVRRKNREKTTIIATMEASERIKSAIIILRY